MGDLDRHQNLIIWPKQPSLRISCKSVRKFLQKVANRQTDWQTSRWVFTARLRPQFPMLLVRGSVVRICGSMQTNISGSAPLSSSQYCCYTQYTTIGGRLPEWQNFKMYFLRQFCLNWVEIFLQYTGDTDAKNDGPEFWNLNCDFWEFFEIFKKASRVPLRPIWTIIVAAKLDHSMVLVTKLRQNQLTVKGRSAGQRHTDRQTRLTIMALQVCNRANRQTDNDDYTSSLVDVTNTLAAWLLLVSQLQHTPIRNSSKPNIICCCVKI